MSDTTPEPADAPDAARADAQSSAAAGAPAASGSRSRKPAAKKPAAKKPAAKKPAGKKPAARKPAAAQGTATHDAAADPGEASAAAASQGAVTTASTVESQPAPAESGAAPIAAPPAPAPAQRGQGSFLDSIRATSMGPAVTGAVVALVLALLLSVLVPSDPGALAMIILGTLLALGVGFAVRYVVPDRRSRHALEAFLAAAVGVHLMSVTGMATGELPLLSQLGTQGPGFNEALLIALSTPPVSAGGVLAGALAAIVVGWGPRR